MGTIELPVRIAVNTGIQIASYPEEMSRPPGRTVMPSPHVEIMVLFCITRQTCSPTRTCRQKWCILRSLISWNLWPLSDLNSHTAYNTGSKQQLYMYFVIT